MSASPIPRAGLSEGVDSFPTTEAAGPTGIVRELILMPMIVDDADSLRAKNVQAVFV